MSTHCLSSFSSSSSVPRITLLDSALPAQGDFLVRTRLARVQDSNPRDRIQHLTQLIDEALAIVDEKDFPFSHDTNINQGHD